MKRLGILLLVFSILAACGGRNQVPMAPMGGESSANRPSSFLTVGSMVTVPGEKEQIVVATPPPPYEPKVDGPAV